MKTLRTVLPAVLVLLIISCKAQEEGPTSQKWELPSDSEIHSLLEKRMQYNGVGIVVGVIDEAGPRVISYGKSGAADNRPLNGDSIFQIGSITKAFTTLLLSDMVNRNEVNLDDPASLYLPHGVTMPERRSPISLRDLATHYSGLPTMPDNFDLIACPDPYEAYTVRQLHDFLSSHILVNPPGVKRSYSNLGVALLGRLLARSRAIEYEQLLKKRILMPLKMHNTAINLNDEQLKRLVPGHDTYLQPVRTWEMSTLPASGSLRSSANDILKLISAYLGYTDTSLEQSMEIQLSERIPHENGWQALGWLIRSDGIIRHSGGKQGYRSGVAINPETGIGAVVLSNARTYDLPMDIAIHLVSGEKLSPPPAAPEAKSRITIPHSELIKFAGLYKFQNNDVFEVAARESHLLIKYSSGSILEFYASAQNEFYFITGNDEITFECDSNGNVTGLILYGDGKNAGQGKRAVRTGT